METNSPCRTRSVGTEDPNSLKTSALAKSKTSLRLEFEIRARKIAAQLGGMEGVQRQLGLSQRQLAKLLMVDPSTMSRWMKNPDYIPPLAWRALQWYFALEEKWPGLSPDVFGASRWAVELEERIEYLERELSEKSKKIEGLQQSLNNPPPPEPWWRRLWSWFR